MALTFTDKMGGKHLAIGGRSWRFYEVTHDGSETSMAASDFDLTEVEFAMAGPHTVPVGSAGTTAQVDLTTSSGKTLAITALSSGAKTSLMLIGW